MSGVVLAQVVVVTVLATVLAFCLSAAEAALQRMTRVRAEELADDGRVGAAALVAVVEQPAPYLAVLAFLRVVAEATTAVLITVAVIALTDSLGKALAISILVMALVSFVLVGVSPRTLGRQNYERAALAAAPVTRALRRVLGPVSHGLIALGNAVTPGKGYRDGPFQTESELRDLLDQASDSSVIEDDEREMIRSVFELGDTVAREVMVPRPDMVTVQGDDPLRKATAVFLRSGFSRLPVIGDDSDDVLGLIYLKDVVARITADPEAGAVACSSLMRPMSFIPESKPIDDLLREMQRDQVHFAVVVDEYGGTAGLVTIEDILEEIVGEIADEYDRDEPGVEPIGDGGYRLPAAMHIDDVAELFDLDIDEDEVDSIGGLLTKALGRVPFAGAHAGIAGLSITAERMAHRHRIATVLVRPLVPLGETESEPLVRRLAGDPDRVGGDDD
ncbi:MAG TPA: hemolysin family protein [Dermatophilaceae bacterium]|jgi:CBS domain containing-hemolysin-like protein|uniref:HlyC/CorC family transporter n=1 Tax=Candidatus Phosphoribacter hodrii TaxID=2953743 RepID=A0A9D7T926_9MICO|nr:HlyC/CorC family transporter [Candidatus Phosphoribacter hodrii]HOA56858.1 hemolysin family protein [Dermatophilaceae bacterium]HOF35316.1 hemolysin family protein [Dermatophilaceae bacterium]HOI04701.1 hemolysin family protein [Dermatophilaceae bacterium]HOR14173.1 hemolysin family protein [Dermatophilaceae bacterium]